jgi:hypothetical protein
MSTYLSGTPTFLPSVQPYEPNLQLYAGALQMKQTQYDTNRKKISNLYGSLLNSPLTRQNSMDARDEYFNTIDYEIKKLANVDLSLEQNVTQATQLFSGLYENENIIKDMMWTKNYQAEMDRAEGFRNCIDPEKCGGQYWEGGVEALQYQRQEFQNITDDEAMSYGDVRYTPFINVGEKANQIFKDNGWNVKMDSPSADGKWIITTKNGEQIIGPLYSHLQSIIGKDPAIAEYYRTKSYLDRKNWVSGKTAEYGSESAALQEYINQKSKEINDAIGNINQDAQYAKDNTQRRAQDLKENIESGKVQNTDRVQSEYDRLFGQAQQFEETEKETSTALTSTQNSLSTQNLRYQAETIDGAMGLVGLNMDLYESAKVLAYKDYERTFKVNEYALNEQSHQFRMQEAKYKSDLEFENDKKILDLEMQGAQLLNERWAGTLASSVTLGDDAAYNQLNQYKTEAQKKAYTNTQAVLLQTYDAAKTAVANGGNGSAQAELDLVHITEQYLNQLSHQATVEGWSNAQEIADQYKEFANGTANDRLAFSKTYDIHKNIGSMGVAHVNAAYGFSVKHYLTGDQASKTTRTYLDAIRPDLAYKAELANESLVSAQQWADTQKETFKLAAEAARTKGNSEYADYYQYLIRNNGGGLANINEFAFNLASDEYTQDRQKAKEKAKDTYRLMYAQDYTKRYNFVSEMNPNASEAEKRRMADNLDYQDKFAEKYAEAEVKTNIPKVIIDKSGGVAKTGSFAVKAENIVEVPYNEFFDSNGNVRSNYAAYAKSYATDGSNFWNRYNYGKKVYNGNKEGERESSFWATVGAAAGAINPALGLAAAGKGAEWDAQNMLDMEGNDFINSFKTMFTEEGVIRGAENHIKLTGLGSGTAQSIDGFVDYSAPMSKNVIEEQSFLRDAFAATRDQDVYFNFGKAVNALPGSSNVQAEQFVKQLIGQALSASKGSKPTWVGSYNPIAGGKEGWQSYTILLNDPTFLKDFVGTKDNPGMYYEYFKDNKEGAVTMYLKDDAAQNALHVQTKTPEIEKLLTVRGSVPLSYGKYDGDISKLTMSRNPTGSGYYINGSIATGIDTETNEYVYSPFNQFYNGGLQDASLINENINQMLDQINAQLQTMR